MLTTMWVHPQSVQRVLTPSILFFKGLCIMMKKKPMANAKKEAMSKMADKAQDKKQMMKEMMKEKMAKAKKKSMK
jgi:hypothetical protein